MSQPPGLHEQSGGWVKERGMSATLSVWRRYRVRPCRADPSKFMKSHKASLQSRNFELHVVRKAVKESFCFIFLVFKFK